jgi:hypothetical protein
VCAVRRERATRRTARNISFRVSAARRSLDNIFVCRLKVRTRLEYEETQRNGEVGFRHLANHQASASHNGITVNSAFLIPRANALASEQAISRSRSSQARLCPRNSNSSTSPVRIRDCRDPSSAFILMNILFDSRFSPIYVFGLVGATLTWQIHPAQKSAHVPRQSDEANCQEFNGQTVAWQVH